MADNMMWCENKYPDGICKLNGEYCVEGPCSHCKPVEYASVRHGRWVQDQQSKFEHRYNCSNCNYRLIDEPTNYCANCGAKMDAKDGDD